MPVLLEGTSVVVRLDAISERYNGYWPHFVDEAPNRTLCSDGELARLGFMETRDAAAYIAALVARGLIAESGGKAIDCVLVEQATGCNLPCPWLECSIIEYEGAQVTIGRLIGGNSTRTSLPDGWKPGSLFQIPSNELEEQTEYLRSEGMVDVYRHRVTGEVLYSGRTTNKGRGWLGRLWNRCLHAAGSFARARKRHGREIAAGVYAGSQEDLEQAALSCRARAEGGLAEAQYELGTMYSAGLGVPCDHVEAAKWYRSAADQGFAQAQCVLGAMYNEGQGVDQDYAQAATWFRRAADQGSAIAEAALGLIFYRGRGIPQDHGVAADWFRRAADHGNASAQLVLANQYRLGEGVTQDDGAAATWLQRAADQGVASAQFDLALMYIDGRGVPQDTLQAYIWFTLAARNYPPGKDQNEAVTTRARFCRSLKRAQVAKAKKLALEWRAKNETGS